MSLFQIKSANYILSLYLAISLNPNFTMTSRNYFALEGHAIQIGMSLRISTNSNNRSNLKLSVDDIKDQASTGIVNVWYNSDMNFVNGVLIQCGGRRRSNRSSSLGC